MPRLELTAVLAKGKAQADAAAKAFGAKRGYGTATDLFNDAEVDLVAVCIKLRFGAGRIGCGQARLLRVAAWTRRGRIGRTTLGSNGRRCSRAGCRRGRAD